MKIEQLFDPATSTYSYLLWDKKTKQAALIDSVKEQVSRDIKFIKQLGLDLKYTMETHIHADHVTGSGQLRDEFDSQAAVHKNSQSECADILLTESDTLTLGNETITVLHTPGHTDTDISFHIDGAVFTGDALLINGCGRTDFQSGDSKTLYHSITEILFNLNDETIVYPGHDYNGFTASTIGHEKIFNHRLGNNRSEAQFITIMDSLILDPPARIDIAVPGNLQCGLDSE
ncbi:MBL-fold metallo-hydrolase superfamily [hydrothermal vent metagenome]|uniref:MBL-fold metallo-hydrolase superfamily n=1 Tax=hydrothermal vent metagenome TaxID=652676 RepID=A0A3B0WG42_9ZZZZ